MHKRQSIFNCDEFNELEKDLIEKYNLQNIDVLKVGHHNSKISSDVEFFMKELGNSFCFIVSKSKIRIGNNFNYIDLLLFNI